jgi:hypothetical protein
VGTHTGTQLGPVRRPDTGTHLESKNESRPRLGLRARGRAGGGHREARTRTGRHFAAARRDIRAFIAKSEADRDVEALVEELLRGAEPGRISFPKRGLTSP